MAIKKTYDPACADLAEHFLDEDPPDPAHVRALALAIQQAVEDWFLDQELDAETRA